MKIRIPHALSRAYDAWEEWVNEPVWGKVRRIDVLLVIGFIGCVSWYTYMTSWQGGLMSGILYLAVMAMALWIL